MIYCSYLVARHPFSICCNNNMWPLRSLCLSVQLMYATSSLILARLFCIYDYDISHFCRNEHISRSLWYALQSSCSILSWIHLISRNPSTSREELRQPVKSIFISHAPHDRAHEHFDRTSNHTIIKCMIDIFPEGILQTKCILQLIL